MARTLSAAQWGGYIEELEIGGLSLWGRARFGTQFRTEALSDFPSFRPPSDHRRKATAHPTRLNLLAELNRHFLRLTKP